jgi:CheY-like chemotaxis protein
MESPNQHIPIVALTALVMPGDRELCLAAGADHYVTKPVEYKEFVRELDVMISRT